MSNIQKLVDQLYSEIDGTLAAAEDVEKRQQMLEADERSLGVRQQEVAKRDAVLTERETIQKRNQEYIDQQTLLLGKQQAKLDADKKEVKRIEQQRKELGEEQTKTQKLLVDLEAKIKELEGLKKLDAELKEREARVTREIVVDRERKRVLDLRVERIKLREQQLQIDSELSEL